MNKANINTVNSPNLALALDVDEVELVLDLEERALSHFDYVAATSDLDDDPLGTYRRMLLRDALMHALVAIRGERKRLREEEDLFLCVESGGQ